MNRSIEKWFSRPAEDVQYRTNLIASLLTEYATTNAQDEAQRIAATPDAQKSFHTGNFSFIMDEFRRSEITLQGGFAFALVDDRAEASFHAPEALAVAAAVICRRPPPTRRVPRPFELLGKTLRSGPRHMSAITDRSWSPCRCRRTTPRTLRDIERSQEQYRDLRLQRRRLRRTYLGLLLLLTVGVLFASTWLALFLSKMVTRPLVALAEATHEISRGRLDYRVDVQAGSEIGQLVESFNRMAADLEASRSSIEGSRRELAEIERPAGATHAAHRDHSGERSLRRALARCLAAHRALQCRACAACCASTRILPDGGDVCAISSPRTQSPISSTCCAKPIAWAAPPARWKLPLRAST